MAADVVAVGLCEAAVTLLALLCQPVAAEGATRREKTVGVTLKRNNRIWYILAQ